MLRVLSLKRIGRRALNEVVSAPPDMVIPSRSTNDAEFPS